jgi:triosephosphate isomerase
MHGLREDGLARARGLGSRTTAAAPRCDIVICPPSTLFIELSGVLDGGPIALGGQDCHAEETGAHTGDLSAPMLADAGCAYAIVGHSERRADHGERDGDVAAKAAAAHAAGLTAVICVGESLAEREAGRALEVVDGQVRASTPDGATTSNTAIAYEPIWAIGTGRTATSADIEAVHAQIRESWESRFSGGGAALRVLYGGSVKAQNAGEILNTRGVDGALVGGASLSVDDFWSICQACP